jgi:hypothetical protein
MASELFAALAVRGFEILRFAGRALKAEQE